MKREAYERIGAHPSRVMADAVPYSAAPASAIGMGLASGGRMRQEIYDDPHAISLWNLRRRARCFVHLSNALVWRAVTGENPPTVPPTAEEYARAGLPWFSYYAADLTALPGAAPLAGAKSVATMQKEKGDVALPENASVQPINIVELRAGLKPGQVREGAF